MVIEKNLFLSTEDLKELLNWQSRKGILSVYVDVKEKGKNARQRWKATIKSGLNGLCDKHPGDETLVHITDKVFEELMSFPQEMVSRSLVYFHCAEPEKSFWRSLQLPLESNFVWMNTAFLRPAIALMDEAPIIGIVVLSKELAKIMTWRQGIIDEREEVQIELESGLEIDPTAGAGVGQLSGSSADRFKKRVEVQINKRLGEVAANMAKMAQEHGWENIILTGSPKFTDVVEENLPVSLQNKVVGILDKNYIKATHAKIEEVTTDLLHNWKRKVEEKQVEELLNEALASGRARVGIQKSIDALEQGRVERLFFNSDMHVAGYRDTNGEYLVDLTPEEAEGLKPEPHIIERMIELAYETNAKVTPLEEKAADILKEHGGVGVVLRY